MNTKILVSKFRKIHLFSFLILSSFIILAYSSNPPNGRTGAIGEGTCNDSGCHTPNNSTLDGNIEISGLPSIVQPNSTYPITITLTNTVGNASRAGFQWVAIDLLNFNNAGNITNPSTVTGQSSAIMSSGGRTYHEHSGSTTFPSTGSISWTADWTAPSSPEGEEIKLYAAGNIANGSGNNGDKIVYTSASTTLSSNQFLTANITNIIHESCSGANDGSAMVVVTNGISPYQYLWDNGETNELAVNLNSGLHTVTVTDSDLATITANVTINSGINLTVLTTDFVLPSCSNSSDGQIITQVTGGTEYSYLWSTGATDPNLININAGTYSLTVTDISGCSKSINTGLGGPTPLEIDLINSSNITCNGAQDGFINIMGMGGSGNYLYMWNTGQIDNNLENLGPGAYQVIVTDDNACSASTIYAITQPLALMAQSISVTDNLCNGDNTGMASINVIGGISPYEYLWPNGDTTAFSQNLSAGFYSVLVSDANECQTIANVIIDEPDVLTSNISLTHETLAGSEDGSAMANPAGGTPDYKYLWSTGDTIRRINDLSPGEYTLTITDANECSLVSTISISEGDCSITVTEMHQNILCYNDQNGSISLNITDPIGNYSIYWSNGIQDTASLYDLLPGDYSVTVVDEGECQIILNDIVIEQADSLIADLIIINSPNCLLDTTGSLALQISGGTQPYLIDWSNGMDTDTISELTSGQYSATVTDANQCVATSQFELIHSDTIKPILLIQDFTLALDALGNMPSYDENDFDLGSSDNCGIAGFTFTQVNADCSGIGNYVIRVNLFDINGNVARDSVVMSLIDNIAPVVNCTDDITLDACENGFYTIPSASDNCGNVTATLIKGLERGSTFPIGTTEMQYDFTDLSGNVSKCTFNITVNSTIDIDIVTTDPSCFNYSNGAVELTINGDHPPHSIEYNQNINTEFLPSGVYSLTVTDDIGCTKEETFEIVNPDILVVSDFSIFDPQTSNSNDGGVLVDVIGGSGNYTYSWILEGIEVSNEEDLINVGPGTYVLTITDSNGCTYVSLPFELSAIVGTQNPDLVDYIKIYPNPTSSSFNIDIDKNAQIDRLEVFTMNGQKVMNINSDNSLKNIDIKDLSTGIYLLKLKMGDRYVIKKLSVVD